MRASATWLDEVPTSAFDAVERLARARPGGLPIPLHQGKTWFEPVYEPRPWNTDEFPLAAHGHAPPSGISFVRREAARYLTRRCGRATDAHDVVIVNGATHGVSTVLNVLLEPGDEVLLLSPQWLFAAGIVRAARGRPVEVPLFSLLGAQPDVDLHAVIEPSVTPRTRALYFNTPNNPTGISLRPHHLRQLADICQRHDLWIVADNAYENYDWTDTGFIDVATVEGAENRTFSVYSLSKTFAMPGYRTGFVATPPGWASRLGLGSLYNVYSQATFTQRAAVAALRTPADVLDERRRLASAAWQRAHEALRVPHTSVEGGLYTLLDLTAYVDGADAFLGRCIDAGVTLAPGTAFGGHLDRHARLCFTAVEPSLLAPALDIVNSVYEEGVR